MKIKQILACVLATAVLLGFGWDQAMAGSAKKSPPWKKHPPKAQKKAKHVKKAKPAPKPRPTIYSARATAVDLTNSLNGAVFLYGDTGPLPGHGGSIDITLGPTNLDTTVSVGGAHVTASGVGGVATAMAEVQNFSVTIADAAVTNTIAFASAAAQARAECTSNGLVLAASSQVLGLVVNGVPVAVTGESNQVVTLANGSLVINAQLSSTNSNRGEIAVAAVFLMLTNGLQGSLAYAEADIRCGSRAPAGTRICDKITGGGFITTTNVPSGTNTSTHASFGVAGGTKRGQFWGHLNYIDHGTGMHVQSTSVTGVTALDAFTRQIDYNVTIDGVAGTARVIIADNGEPGRNDIFDIALSTGYHAAGTLGGGNIQLHKCPPGWSK